MLALLHIVGGLVLIAGAGLVIAGVLLSLVYNWWVFIPPGVALLVAAAWLISR